MKKTNLIMRIVPLIVFAAIIVYLAVYIVRALDNPFTTATATLYTVYDSVPTRGVVVRDEEWLIYSGGMVSITAEDGARVSAGGEIAAVYSSEEDFRKAERADFLVSQAEYLDAISSGREADNPIDYDSKIKSLVRELRSALDIGNTSGASEKSLELQTLAFNANDGSSIEERLSELNSELESLGTLSSFRLTTIFAGRSGIFQSAVDGWESLSPEQASSLSLEQVEDLLDGTRTVPSTAVGKLIYGEEWYYLAIADSSETAHYSKGDYVTVSFGRWMPDTVSMKIESKTDYPDGRTLLWFSCSRSMSEASALRLQNADLIRSSYDGLRIPRKALHTDGTQDFVYVMTGLQAEKKTVTILLDAGDFYIIRSEAGRPDAVHPGDTVIVTGKGLYDGKVVS